MSVYTTEVRYICEMLAGNNVSKDGDKVDEILHSAYAKIFDDFPIFDELYKEDLCVKILKHYYTREIGLETYGVWKLKLNAKMQEIMPYYNKLYESERLTISPLTSNSTTRQLQGDYENENLRTDNLKNETENERINDLKNVTDTINKQLDTPQSRIENLDKYLTNAETNNEESKSTGNVKENGINKNTGTVANSGNNSERIIETISGYNESQAKLLMQYRKTFLNIDMLVIEELADLFMNIW